jgi:hypothetical protein
MACGAVRCTVCRGRSAPLLGAQINEVKERIAMKEGELIDIEAEFAVPYHTSQPHRLAPARTHTHTHTDTHTQTHTHRHTYTHTHRHTHTDTHTHTHTHTDTRTHTRTHTHFGKGRCFSAGSDPRRGGVAAHRDAGARVGAAAARGGEHRPRRAHLADQGMVLRVLRVLRRAGGWFGTSGTPGTAACWRVVWYCGYPGYCGVLAGGSRGPNGGTRTG